ncbi:MFS general substrate transporter [Penicillium angulare]|uniref:MFS general substrate transporter n=1 Tax=Penicillium angulare TaxID=116970 RepID=UPI002540DF9A|nr:MFS general substrate transporter [Penicillium angulare]KAJ5272457.1 MFS general substrate transporter [Penicillium angulare]
MTIVGNVAGPCMFDPEFELLKHNYFIPAVIWTFVPSNGAGRTKKSVTETAGFVAYCAVDCVEAQIFQSKDAPRCIPAIVVCSIMYALEIVIMIAWRTYYIWQNKRRAKLIADLGMSEEESGHQGRLNAELDMTDYENIRFKYSV